MIMDSCSWCQRSVYGYVYQTDQDNDDKPAAVAVPSLMSMSKKKEVSIATDGLGTEIATVQQSQRWTQLCQRNPL